MRFWRLCLERRWVWLPAVAALFLNGALTLGYRTLVADRFDLAALKRDRLESDFRTAAGKRDELKRSLEGWRAVETGVADFYARAGSREERLPDLLREIDDMARKAGAVPHRITFDQSFLKDADLAEFGIVFPFEGDYGSVRNLLNFIEVTPTFLILDTFNLTSAGDLQEKVRLQFRLRTVFHQEAAP